MSKWSTGSLLKLGAGLYSVKQQYDAGRAAKDAANRNADRAMAEAAEEKRRARRQQRKKQSALRARAAASGIKLTGSTKTFLDDYVEEDERQLSWLDRSANSRAEIMRQQGKDDEKNARYGAYASFFRTTADWVNG